MREIKGKKKKRSLIDFSGEFREIKSAEACKIDFKMCIGVINFSFDRNKKYIS